MARTGAVQRAKDRAPGWAKVRPLGRAKVRPLGRAKVRELQGLEDWGGQRLEH